MFECWPAPHPACTCPCPAGFGWPIAVDKQGVLSREEGDVPPFVYGYEAAEGTAQVRSWGGLQAFAFKQQLGDGWRQSRVAAHFGPTACTNACTSPAC